VEAAPIFLILESQRESRFQKSGSGVGLEKRAREVVGASAFEAINITLYDRIAVLSRVMGNQIDVVCEIEERTGRTAHRRGMNPANLGSGPARVLVRLIEPLKYSVPLILGLCQFG
jgi:hypothetical protein